MKKSFLMIFGLFLIGITFKEPVLAASYENVRPINAMGETQLFIDLALEIDTCTDISGNKFNLEPKNALSEEVFIKLDEELQNKILECSNADDYIIVLNLCSRNKEDPYPDIEPLNIKISVEEKVGGSRIYLMGTNYKLYHIKNSILCDIEVGESNVKEVEFTIGELGYYVLYYDPRVYNVDFFEEEIEYDDNRNIVNEVYFTANELAQFDNLYFPEIPEKEGYVFTGWKQNKRKGAYDTYCYIEYEKDILLDEWKIYPCDVRNIYASWCPEDEYTPLEVTIESEEKITKGKEDGCEIILTLSEGRFDDVIDEDIENDWRIVGNDELLIASAERIDDRTAKLTLSGNSSDKHKTSEIKIEFNSKLYISYEEISGSDEIHEIADIQLDENGIKKAMFISDNSITLEKQKKSGNGGGVEKHTVSFETNGGETIQSVRIANGHTLEEPERVLKEGYVFVGWYIDEELTTPYDFENSVTESFTLYAAWEKPTENEPDLKQIVSPVRIIEKFIELLKSIMH